MPLSKAYLRLIEIMQCRENQESETCTDPWRGWCRFNGAYVRQALAMGHRVGLTGGTDNHCGWPGRAYAESEFPAGCNADPRSTVLTGV